MDETPRPVTDLKVGQLVRIDLPTESCVYLITDIGVIPSPYTGGYSHDPKDLEDWINVEGLFNGTIKLVWFCPVTDNLGANVTIVQELDD